MSQNIIRDSKSNLLVERMRWYTLGKNRTCVKISDVILYIYIFFYSAEQHIHFFTTEIQVEIWFESAFEKLSSESRQNHSIWRETVWVPILWQGDNHFNFITRTVSWLTKYIFIYLLNHIRHLPKKSIWTDTRSFTIPITHFSVTFVPRFLQQFT